MNNGNTAAQMDWRHKNSQHTRKQLFEESKSVSIGNPSSTERKINITHITSRYHLCANYTATPSPYISKTHQRTANRVMMRLEDTVDEALPCRPGLHLLALTVDKIPIELTAAGIDIHLSSPEPSTALPEVSGNPEGGNDKESEVSLEEVLGSTDVLADGRNSSVKLGDVSFCDTWSEFVLEHT